MNNLYNPTPTEQIDETAINPSQLLACWQGHRRLTRRVIESFPELELLTFSLGRMRPFARLATEMIDMAVPTLNGLISGEWEFAEADKDEQDFVKTKADLLQLWDDTTAAIEILWKQIPDGRFQESELAFDTFDGPVYQVLQYVIDNEIHHRGQAYVYLRVLGIAPPLFMER